MILASTIIDLAWTSLIIGFLVVVGIALILPICIVIALINYAAKKNAEKFDYDYLAKKIADEIQKNQITYDQQKRAAEEYKKSIDSQYTVTDSKVL